MFHVEQRRGGNPASLFENSHVFMNYDWICSRKIQKVFYFVVVAPTSAAFFDPTSKYLRKDCGTAIGSCHSH